MIGGNFFYITDDSGWGLCWEKKNRSTRWHLTNSPSGCLSVKWGCCTKHYRQCLCAKGIGHTYQRKTFFSFSIYWVGSIVWIFYFYDLLSFSLPLECLEPWLCFWLFFLDIQEYFFPPSICFSKLGDFCYLSVKFANSYHVNHEAPNICLLCQDGGDVEVTGSPTEKAILSWAVKVSISTIFQCLHYMCLFFYHSWSSRFFSVQVLFFLLSVWCKELSWLTLPEAILQKFFHLNYSWTLLS